MANLRYYHRYSQIHIQKVQLKQTKMNNEKIEADIRDNKVKQGLLLKQSRHLKEWKQRWMVLTKTHLYSFSAKGQYKDPTEIIPLKDVQTTKSYYKDQYKKPFTFRVQSPDVNLHMSTKSSDEKWAWMTAIQKMIERVIHPEQKTDTYNLIRQTIKMSTAVRQTLQKKQQKERKQSTDFTNHLLRKIKMRKQNDVCSYQFVPDLVARDKKLSLQEETFFVIDRKKGLQTTDKKPISKIDKDSAQKVMDKKVEVPAQRVIEKIVKVPEIVQKIVYRDPPANEQGNFSQVLKQLIKTPSQNPRPLVNFVVYLLTSKLQQYQPQVLDFCLDPQSRRFFAEVFLLMMNQETDQQTLNSYLKFLLVLYENCSEYFYSSDLKALISILLREMEMNRSEFNQYLIMSLIKQMSDKDWWGGLNYRKTELKNFVKQLGAVSGSQNQYLSQQLLKKI